MNKIKLTNEHGFISAYKNDPHSTEQELTCIDVSDLLQVKLGEFLPRVLDSSADAVVLKDPPQVHVNQGYDLCSRLAAVMESIHKSSVVVVK